MGRMTRSSGELRDGGNPCGSRVRGHWREDMQLENIISVEGGGGENRCRPAEPGSTRGAILRYGKYRE